ncbi:SLC13 family permease [Sphingomonas sp. CJ99]
MISPPLLSTVVLVVALALFASERVRHDLVALIALFAAIILGLVRPEDAFSGFADPAVVTVAAVLVIGRAIELSGVASAIAGRLIPPQAGFTLRLSILLVVGAALSAFMNNIAALVITMPLAADIARRSGKAPGATLMPLAFATILGGMTTLIGTPANLILSSVRKDQLGEGFGFFTMTAVGTAVTVAGLGYLAVIGWKLLPTRGSMDRETRAPWRVFELGIPAGWDITNGSGLLAALRTVPARLVAAFRSGSRFAVRADTAIRPGDRLLLLSRVSQRETAEKTGLVGAAFEEETAERVTARVVVAHGSSLIGARYADVGSRSAHELEVVGVGPRVARERRPLAEQVIRRGDQLYLRGDQSQLAAFIARARLLEIDRLDLPRIAPAQAFTILGVFAGAIVLLVAGLVPAAIAFTGAALLLGLLRMIPADESYRAIDWPVIVLLAAMIPVGRSFEDSGAAAIAAAWLGQVLMDLPLFGVLCALSGLTLVLTIFLNNVATAVVMGPLAIGSARLLDIDPDAALLAVLIGTSADFLTPIGHQNNLMVMGPGGYRFTDFARMGAPLVVVVVLVSSAVLAATYG